jgi:Mg-chelatase subunit ChlD
MVLKHKVFNLIILDESGSMDAIKDFIISGFNEVVQTVKGLSEKYPDQEHIISLVTFNGLATNTLLDLQQVDKLEQIDSTKYNPNSTTPLYDAMGSSIARLKNVTNLLSDYNVVVTILTDGQENASIEFKSATIKNMVTDLKSKNWVFTYIGANHDVVEAAKDIAIDNVMSFMANESSIKAMFQKEKKFREFVSEKIESKESLQGNLYQESEKEQ